MKNRSKLIVLFCFAAGLLSCKTKTVTDNTNVTAGKKGSKTIELERMAHEKDSNLTFYDWNEGYLKAKRLNKILLVDVYTEWCGWCKVMDTKTYAVPSVIQVLNKDFVCVKFNPEVANSNFIFDTTIIDNKMLHAFLFDKRSSGYPTTSFWINPNKKERLEVIPGYKDASSFTELLQTMVAIKTSKP